ncbi:hypothetical protein HYH03_006681 [Edaphochlamys debaryana]|uniref:Uncharacterized protein n=1 Tax=Edaphochlamys debaryana TaxID=47281 RepID=A0A836BZV2_9CHLO|nr:hypothetical protein HYH03_006681 [Edaphochlamys debaryana]|eukprot:KAG2495070.1 hypothetical protein HYH03_006681 [Edaphochlamys debaryana]
MSEHAGTQQEALSTSTFGHARSVHDCDSTLCELEVDDDFVQSSDIDAKAGGIADWLLQQYNTIEFGNIAQYRVLTQAAHIYDVMGSEQDQGQTLVAVFKALAQHVDIDANFLVVAGAQNGLPAVVAYALQLASALGRKERARFQADLDWALREAVRIGSIKICKSLRAAGANIHAPPPPVPGAVAPNLIRLANGNRPMISYLQGLGLTNGPDLDQASWERAQRYLRAKRARHVTFRVDDSDEDA